MNMILSLVLAATTLNEPCTSTAKCSAALVAEVRNKLESVRIGDPLEKVTESWGDGMGGLEYIAGEQFFAEMYVVSADSGSCSVSALVEAHFDHDWRVCDMTEPFLTGFRYITRVQFERLTIGQSRCAVEESLGEPPHVDGDSGGLEYIIVDGDSHYFVVLTFSAEGRLIEKNFYTR